MSDDSGSTDDAKSITNKEAWDFFLNGPRDVFTCESCGADAHRGNPPDAPGAFYAEVDNKPVIICDKCDEKYDWVTVEARIRERRRAITRSPLGDWVTRFRQVLRPVSEGIPVPLSVHEVSPKSRTSLIPETTVFLGRFALIVGLTATVLAVVALFVALTGSLFVSPVTGVRWFFITVNMYRQWALFLVARPVLVLGVTGLEYLVHLFEYQRHIADLRREMGQRRPRWHYVTLVVVVGLVGWALWVLSQFDVLGQVYLPVGVLTWSAGAFALVYFLHETLLADRWSYGLRIHSALWKFPVQFAVGLMLYDGVIGLPGPETNTIAVAIVPPFVGLLYVTRRYLAFTALGAEVSRWFEPVAHRWRQAIPWPAKSPLRGREGSPETSQFGQLDDASREDRDRDAAGTSGLDREEELRQTREWASYLESELHDREEQLRDLEARLAQVGQELQETREVDSNDEPAAGERDDLLTDLFDIRDNFQRALDAETYLEDYAAADLSEGIELIDRQIKSILEREGVEEIDTSGTVDPTKHRVVKTVPAADFDPGEIVDVYQLGYRLDDGVLREAHVVVAEEPAAAEDGDVTDGDSQVNRRGDAS